MTTHDVASPSRPFTTDAASAPPSGSASTEALHAEARALSRYILGRDASPTLLQRYADAHVHLDVGGATASDSATLAIALSHPRLLPSLDAATAFVRPQSLLHRKALLMTAILEASPDHADLFLPRSGGWLALGWLGARIAVSSAAQLAVGLPVLLMIERRNRP